MSHIFDALNKKQPKDNKRPEIPEPPAEKSNETSSSEVGESEVLDAASTSDTHVSTPPVEPPDSPTRPATPPETKVMGASTRHQAEGPGSAKKEHFFQVGLDKANDMSQPPPNLYTQPRVSLKPATPEWSVSGGLLDCPNPNFLEELDELYGNLESLMLRPDRHVVAFTGSVAGEGGTTIAAHFAHLLAGYNNKQVLLVDGDMSRSDKGLSAICDDRRGLSDLLRANINLGQVILQSEIPLLHFLPAGLDQDSHVDAARSGRTRKLFDRLGKMYDWVVIDSPAILEHKESISLCAAGDGVVLIINSHCTRRELAVEALSRLNLARCRILGSVLNSHQEKIPGFLRERI